MSELQPFRSDPNELCIDLQIPTPLISRQVRFVARENMHLTKALSVDAVSGLFERPLMKHFAFQ